MTKTYEVIGHYPAFRPLKTGAKVELTEEQAKYHVLNGALKEGSKPVETAGTATQPKLKAPAEPAQDSN